jgi:hypothetical protein
VYAHENAVDIETNCERASPIPEQLNIWLHSYQYSAQTNDHEDDCKWDYKCAKPDWAQEDFDDSMIEGFWNNGGLWNNMKNL